jgi:endonuclease/exonuclease/phosphatase family metal-dependent hydrolase
MRTRSALAAALGLLIAAPSGAVPAPKLKLLTLNIAGLPFVHPKLSERMRAIGEEVAAGGYDVVALQEAWLDADADFLAKAAGLPHYLRVRRDVAIGTGLAFLSREPMEAARQKVFTSRPSALRVYHGEWPANKGVLSVRLETSAGPLDVYDTHLISSYAGAPYYTLRVTQVFDLAEEILSRSGDRPFVLMGDLNAAPGEPEFQLLLDLLDLEDACLEKGKDLCGPTGGPRRIDHVLVPRGGRKFVSGRRVLDAPVRGLRLSDHAGVAAELDLGLLKLRPKRDAARRRAALAVVMKAADDMVERMHERLRRRAWIPVYGMAMSIRYARQLDQLADVRARAETALIRARISK